MSEKPPKKEMSEAHNSFHAEKRRARRGDHNKQGGKQPWMRAKIDRDNTDRLYIYGLHTVRHAIENPERIKKQLFCTANGLARLEIPSPTLEKLEVIEQSPKELDKKVGSDAVHQGVVLEVQPLSARSLEALGETDLILVLDQVTDPHNVGAMLRSAVALGAGAIVTTSRYSPIESGVLAKAASGALDMIDHIEVRNLADALEKLTDAGFTTIGLDSEEAEPFEQLPSQDKIALVLGAEGKGLRQKTRTTCQHLARLDMPGPIKSLNVSNAAVLSLYLSRQKLSA